MKIISHSSSCIGALLVLSLSMQAAEPVSQPEANSPGWNYRPGVGLIYGDGKVFAEGTGKALLDHATKSGIQDVPLGDFHLGNADTWRFGIRMQESFEDTNGAANPATFEWSRQDGVEDWNARGAILLDLYAPTGGPLGYDWSKRSFHLTFGAQINKFEENGKDVDNQTFFGLIDFKPHFMGGQGDFWKQPIRVGGVFHRDLITDSEDWGLILRYDPLIRLFKSSFGLGMFNQFDDAGSGNFNVTKLADHDDNRGGHRTTGKPGTPFDPSSAASGNDDPTTPTSRTAAGFAIRPLIGFKLADGSAPQKLRDLSDTYLQYGGTASLSLFHQRVELGYSVVCHTALSGHDDTHVNQTAFINVTPRPRSGKSPLYFRAAWHSGEAAPTFEDHEGFTIGVGIKL